MVYSGRLQHPLISLQLKNQVDIIVNQSELVETVVLNINPITSAESLIMAITTAAKAADTDPPLAPGQNSRQFTFFLRKRNEQIMPSQ